MKGFQNLAPERLTEIAKLGGCSSWRHSVLERDRRRQIVKQLTHAGESAAQIAVRLGVTDRTVVRDRARLAREAACRSIR